MYLFLSRYGPQLRRRRTLAEKSVQIKALAQALACRIAIDDSLQRNSYVHIHTDLHTDLHTNYEHNSDRRTLDSNRPDAGSVDCTPIRIVRLAVIVLDETSHHADVVVVASNFGHFQSSV